MSKDNGQVSSSSEASGGERVVRFEPRLHVTAVLGVGINAQDGTVVLALQGPRNPRVEIAMTGEVAEVVLASLTRTIERARYSPAP
ncbi:hypothetical protein [Ferrovibrio sp.]|uniref:hypothetical protein n=1 Tax=Ferrovibrio sp. TaxID=1917215 RepID=UPI003D0E3212